MRAEAPSAKIDLLLRMLDGARYANAIMPWGKPAPIVLPEQADDRARLIEAHLSGTSAEIDYAPANQPLRRMRLEVVTLAAFNPGADGHCRWLAIDLDGADHGQHGLQNPAQAAKCIAEQVFKSGLGDGLIVARSRRGVGRHIFFVAAAPGRITGCSHRHRRAHRRRLSNCSARTC